VETPASAKYWALRRFSARKGTGIWPFATAISGNAAFFEKISVKNMVRST
jgi:hypothetical protein